VDLIVKESDNNVKLIVLDRFDVLRAKHEHVLDGYVLDILKVLSSPDMEVKRKAIGVALEMVTSRNVEEVVLFLKKQLQNTLEQDFDKVGLRLGIGSLTSWLITLLHRRQNLEYRQLLIQSIHSCAIKFSEVAASVVHVLMDFLGDSNNPSAVDVISFVRWVFEQKTRCRVIATADEPDTSQRGRRKVPQASCGDHPQACKHLQRHQVGQSVSWGVVDCRRVLRGSGR
jgi:coatomer subunit beta